MTKRILFLLIVLSLFVPTVVLVANYAREEAYLKTLPDVVIPISGYDPRDVLRGHYLAFRYDWPLDKFVRHDECHYSGQKNSTPCALCIRRTDDATIRVQVTQHPEATRCDAVLPDVIYEPGDEYEESRRPHFADWSRNQRRFYVPEEHGPALDELFRKGGHQFAIRAKIAKDNRIVNRDLLIDGKPYQQALWQQSWPQ